MSEILYQKTAPIGFFLGVHTLRLRFCLCMYKYLEMSDKYSPSRCVTLILSTHIWCNGLHIWNRATELRSTT